MLQADDMVSRISPAVKTMGYKKNRLSWHKAKDRLTIVFSIQKSQYSPDAWYYAFGICLHDITDGNRRSIKDCQITYRVDNVVNGVLLSPENIVHLLQRWESMYGDLARLRICAVEGTLPGQQTMHALRYLSSVNLSHLRDEE